MKSKIVDSSPLPKSKRRMLVDDNRLKGDGMVMGGSDLDISFEGSHVLVTIVREGKYKETIEVPNPIYNQCGTCTRDEGPWFKCTRLVAWIGRGRRGHKYSLCSFHKNEMKDDARIVEWKRMPRFGEWGVPLPFEKVKVG